MPTSSTREREIRILKKGKNEILDVLTINVTEKDKTFIIPKEKVREVPVIVDGRKVIEYTIVSKEQVVPVPKIDPADVKEKTEEAIAGAVAEADLAGILERGLKKVPIEKPEYVKKKIDVPMVNTDELAKRVEDAIKIALGKLDLTAILKGALETAKIKILVPDPQPFPYKDPKPYDYPVPVIKDGRTVFEHDIRKREMLITLKGYKIVDEKGGVIKEVKPEVTEG